MGWPYRIGYLQTEHWDHAPPWQKAYSQDKKDVIQQKALLELFPKLSPLHLNSQIPPELFNLSFQDVSFFGALLLPSEARPCQATCSQTNLEEPKHKTEDDL